MYKCPVVHPSNAIILDYWPIILMMCTFKPTTVEVSVCPPFTPNEYLYKTHGDGNKPKWEIMGDAVRDVMCEVSGLEKCD